jgi:predicted phosphodiesterase
MDGRKLLVLSDSHGEVDALAAVLKWAKNNAVDAAIFLGDGIHAMPRAEAAAGFFGEKGSGKAAGFKTWGLPAILSSNLFFFVLI